MDNFRKQTILTKLAARVDLVVRTAAGKTLKGRAAKKHIISEMRSTFGSNPAKWKWHNPNSPVGKFVEGRARAAGGSGGAGIPGKLRESVVRDAQGSRARRALRRREKRSPRSLAVLRNWELTGTPVMREVIRKKKYTPPGRDWRPAPHVRVPRRRRG